MDPFGYHAAIGNSVNIRDELAELRARLRMRFPGRRTLFRRRDVEDIIREIRYIPEVSDTVRRLAPPTPEYAPQERYQPGYAPEIDLTCDEVIN